MLSSRQNQPRPKAGLAASNLGARNGFQTLQDGLVEAGPLLEIILFSFNYLEELHTPHPALLGRSTAQKRGMGKPPGLRQLS